VAWSDEVSDAFGAIKVVLERQGHGSEDIDIAIAAHALAHGAALVMANRAHTARIARLKVEDWGIRT
jgi:tRNA(fMet)-specific endonuclease VapC